MKSRKLLMSIGLLTFSLCSLSIHAQTQQVVLNGTVINGLVLCDKIVNGYVTYHFTYHLGKDGITKIHWNLFDYEIRDVETNERYKLTDVGNDNSLEWLPFFNNINSSNEGYGFSYDVEDGWLDEYLPAVYPNEGTYVEMNFQVRGKEFKAHWKVIDRLSFDSNGDLVYRSCEERIFLSLIDPITKAAIN